MLPFLPPQVRLELTGILMRLSIVHLGALSLTPPDLEGYRTLAGLALMNLASLAIDLSGQSPDLEPLLQDIHQLRALAAAIKDMRPPGERLTPNQYKKKMLSLVGLLPAAQSHIAIALTILATQTGVGGRPHPDNLIQQQLHVLRALFTTYLRHILADRVARWYLLACQSTTAPGVICTEEQANELGDRRLPPQGILIAELQEAVQNAAGPPPTAPEGQGIAAEIGRALQSAGQGPRMRRSDSGPQHVPQPTGSLLRGLPPGFPVQASPHHVQHSAGPASEPPFGFPGRREGQRMQHIPDPLSQPLHTSLGHMGQLLQHSTPLHQGTSSEGPWPSAEGPSGTPFPERPAEPSTLLLDQRAFAPPQLHQVRLAGPHASGRTSTTPDISTSHSTSQREVRTPSAYGVVTESLHWPRGPSRTTPPRPPSPDTEADAMLAKLLEIGLTWEEVFPDSDDNAATGE